MTEGEVKRATCLVLCEGTSGTGWLVAEDRVLTALHNVQRSIEEGKTISVRFDIDSTTRDLNATVLSLDEDLDVCLLRLAEPVLVRPISLDASESRPGENWSAFGYPTSKLDLGHFLEGEVRQVLAVAVHGIDLELGVRSIAELDNYQGLSGAALMTGATCRGMLRISVSKAIGAVSVAMMKPFLLENGLFPDAPSEPGVEDGEEGKEEGDDVALRPDFDRQLESFIVDDKESYLFLEGAHGIGKSTYCQNFSSDERRIDILGVYAFSDKTRGSTPALQAQPEIFHDWVSSLLSMKATGKPARLSELSYPRLIQQSHVALRGLAERCAGEGRVGVLFIDGVNEVAATSSDALARFMALLPQALPAGLKIVVTGVGLEALSGKLGGLLQGSKRLTLPSLQVEAQRELCYAKLKPELASPDLVASLCERAKGHPLYLHYLIDLVNAGTTEKELSELPAFSGSIEDYYETIWSGLQHDLDVVNLLGIIARLRWGINTSELVPMLETSESAALVSTMSKIRHLLLSPDNTVIYHPSFSDFVIHKTSAVGEWIQGRLATHCLSPSSADYGTQNRVHHALLGADDKQKLGVDHCHQDWVDKCVLLGAEPDVLLSDVEHALDAATRIGGAKDVIRVLLLSQRLLFRYDTLFAQSAELVALALIALGKAEEAIRHILRHEHLIVDPEAAFVVVVSLVRAGKSDEALEVLERVERKLIGFLARGEFTFKQYASVSFLRSQLHALVSYAGANSNIDQFFQREFKRLNNPAFEEFSQEAKQDFMRMIFGSVLGSALCLESRYKPVAEMPLADKIPSLMKVLLLDCTLHHANVYTSMYGIRPPAQLMTRLLADFAEHLDDSLLPESRHFSVLNNLIEAGAGLVLVSEYAKGVEIGAGRVPLFVESRALGDEAAFEEAYERVRADCFLAGKASFRFAPALPSRGTWEASLEEIARSSAECDAFARGAKASGDTDALVVARERIVNVLLPCLRFTLESRVRWEESYFMPENVIPLVYGRIVRVYLDCFPEQILSLLDVLDTDFWHQFGLYNEGFRRILNGVLAPCIEAVLEGEAADRVFGLLIRWRDYVLDNVQNRLELVPELLQLIPLLVRTGATEEASNTYQSVLDVSMGPSWYKEDQLSLMSDALAALPETTAVVPATLAQIAAYLERASGEMTFQRYVRADKAAYIAQLYRRGLGASAVQYLQHQSCGSTQELFEQASLGDLDRVTPLKGIRFPGASLEEQATVLKLIQDSGPEVEWRLRWALLEVYHHGDARHLDDWGAAYAALINELIDRASDVTWSVRRIRSIAGSMNDDRAWLMMQALVATLQPLVRASFASLLDEIRSRLTDSRVEQLTHGFGVRNRRPKTSDSELNAVPERGGEAAGNAEDSGEAEEAENGGEKEEEWATLPGTFGSRSATKDARRQLEAAREQLRRNNARGAAQTCVSALIALQAGGWSVWQADSLERVASGVIRQSSEDGDVIARMYAPLIMDERYVARWRVASHLIDLVADKLSADDQLAVLGHAVDHVGYLVGSAPSDDFDYIGGGPRGSASESLVELLLWSLDHPLWERRDSAASMVLWLARHSDALLAELARLASSSDPRNRADVASGVLDVLSREDANGTWGRVEAHLATAGGGDGLDHVGRLVVLGRVTERASKQGLESARVFLESIPALLEGDSSREDDTNSIAQPFFVPRAMREVWWQLDGLGVLGGDALAEIESAMSIACLPLSIADAMELEALVAESVRASANAVGGRWAARVRYALHKGLFKSNPLSNYRKIEAALRFHNPSSLSEPQDGRSIIAALKDAIVNKRERSYRPSSGDVVLLDVQCSVEIDRVSQHVELTSYLVPPGTRPSLGYLSCSFFANELPRPGEGKDASTCGRCDPMVVHFGAVTPAIAKPSFLQRIGANSSSIVRYHWRDGHTVETRDVAREHDVAVLGIRRDALKLPPGWGLVWSLHLNGEPRALLQHY